MSRTLLLDLDNTLLNNSNFVFIPALIEAMSRALADIIETAALPDHFLQGTRVMISNDRPDRSVLEAFLSEFSARTGVDQLLLEERLDRFYREKFDELQGLTTPVNGAEDFIREAERRGYRIAIATNPLYPRSAIDRRLAWANLPHDRYQFDLVSSNEGFHFTKPNPAFYAEVLAQMGWPAGEIIVVGDSPENDIEPAQTLGLASFQILTSEPIWHGENTRAFGCGDLRDFFTWLDTVPLELLLPDFEQPSAMNAILASSPAALNTLLRKADDLLLSHRLQDGEWNITEVICHLRDVEREVQYPRIRQVLAEANPLLAGENTDRWADERGYCFQDAYLALKEFTECRLEALALLKSIPQADWERPARHTILGPTNLRELVSIAAEHDRLHLHQTYELENTYPGLYPGIVGYPVDPYTYAGAKPSAKIKFMI